MAGQPRPTGPHFDHAGPPDALIYETDARLHGLQYSFPHFSEVMLQDDSVWAHPNMARYRRQAAEEVTGDLAEIAGPYSRYCAKCYLSTTPPFIALMDLRRMLTDADRAARRRWAQPSIWHAMHAASFAWDYDGEGASWIVAALAHLDTTLFRVAFLGLDLATPVPRARRVWEAPPRSWSPRAPCALAAAGGAFSPAERAAFQPFAQWLRAHAATLGAPVVDLFFRARREVVWHFVVLPAQRAAPPDSFWRSRALLTRVYSFLSSSSSAGAGAARRCLLLVAAAAAHMEMFGTPLRQRQQQRQLTQLQSILMLTAVRQCCAARVQHSGGGARRAAGAPVHFATVVAIADTRSLLLGAQRGGAHTHAAQLLRAAQSVLQDPAHMSAQQRWRQRRCVDMRLPAAAHARAQGQLDGASNASAVLRRALFLTVDRGAGR
ncbi:hypothetical protein JKP88DRAFT_338062 [Tribonema minus]|uniref:Uncharacterized protein n=1 Tax=Tribonema minus TaxID=303371 RepID=A0A835YJG2_9STRA|nr:hypothetical protein JKP88DRAFT_338062 [Tribonema minus]